MRSSCSKTPCDRLPVFVGLVTTGRLVLVLVGEIPTHAILSPPGRGVKSLFLKGDPPSQGNESTGAHFENSE